MARGKHGTAQAIKRETSATERIAELVAQLETERKETAAREQELRAELQQLQGRFSRAVREAASTQVLAVQERAREQVAEVVAKDDQRMREVLKYLLSNKETIQLTMERWTRLADLAGIKWGDFMGLSDALTLNTKQRRMTTRMARFNTQVAGDPDSIGIR